MENNQEESNDYNDLFNQYQHPQMHQDISKNFFPDDSKIKKDNPSTIYKNTNSNFTITSEMSELLESVGFPYPNLNIDDKDKTDIPEIKIKDEMHFMDETSISKYISDIGEVNERLFNICRKCKKGNNNLYYCHLCKRNLCKECKIDCEIKKHPLTNLIDMNNETISKVIWDISRIIYLQFKKKDKVQSNEKQQEIYKLDISAIDENKSVIQENIENFSQTKDIELICRIISQKHQYINYFHYNNILLCYEYVDKRYAPTAGNNCLKIIYDVQSLKKKKIQIFHHEFVENNKDKLTLIINNKSSPLVEIAVANDDDYYVEVILIQKPNCYLENLSKMFCECERLIGINGHLIHDLIDCGEVKDISCMFMNCKIIPTINLYLFKNLFRENKEMNMDNLFYGCEELIKIEGLEINNESSDDNMFYGCKKYKILDNNTLINNNEVSELNKKSKEEEIIDIVNLLRNKNFKEAFEKAIKSKDYEILCIVIDSFVLNPLEENKETIKFLKDNIKDLLEIIINGIKDIIIGYSKCKNFITITSFIKIIFVDNEIHDKELSNVIIELYKKRDNLKKFKTIEFEEEELKEIYDFFKN